MSSIKVHNLSKAYRSYSSEWHRFAHWFGASVKLSEEQWILKNITFDVHPGEAVGIIGQNGAGKSTLLKLITGTLAPTEGEIKSNGRIAAILELGMGFNPELSGRQNSVHSAGLMGFNDKEISHMMPDIETFADIGEYFDHPMRTYSSGMQMRVAFSTITASRPDVLIVDEALSVGDTFFQHKCFTKILEFREQGTTLLMVSHDRAAIQGLCTRAILLGDGKVVKDGMPEEVFDYYNAIISGEGAFTTSSDHFGEMRTETSSGSGEAQVERVTLRDRNGKPSDSFNVGEQIEIEIKVKINKPIDSLVLGYSIKDRLGQIAFGTNTWHTEQTIHNPKSGDSFIFKIKFLAILGIGSYSISTSLHDKDTHLEKNYEWKDLALVFNILNKDRKVFEGSCWMEPKIEVLKQ